MTTDVDSAPGYHLVQRIGRGGSSVVWKAQHVASGRVVAVKILRGDVSDGPALRRFARERAVLRTLSGHPGIVPIIDAGVHGGRPWLAMEHCGRGSLARHIAVSGPLAPGPALAVLAWCAQALHAAHSAGVLHCDVKPGNILVNDRGHPALADFGIARVAASTTTSHGGFSVDHAAPELLDEGPVTAASDVYSLGTTVWELLAARPPFREGGPSSMAAVMRRVLTCPLPDPPEGTPPALAALLRSMTQKDPADRPGDMTAVLAAADAVRRTMHDEARSGPVVHSLPAAAPSRPIVPDPADAWDTQPRARPIVVAPQPRRGPTTAPRRRPLLLALVTVALLAILSVGAVLGYQLLTPAGPPAAVVGDGVVLRVG